MLDRCSEAPGSGPVSLEGLIIVLSKIPRFCVFVATPGITAFIDDNSSSDTVFEKRTFIGFKLKKFALTVSSHWQSRFWYGDSS